MSKDQRHVDETMIRETTDNIETGISVGGRIINTIRYADDKVVVANMLEKVHRSLSAVTHAAIYASMLRPASQAGPMHESAWVGKLVNAALLSLINEAFVNVCCSTLLSSELVGRA